MVDIASNFSGVWGDLETLFYDTELSEYNAHIAFSDNSRIVVRIIGITKLDNDYLVHIVPVMNDEMSTPTSELIHSKRTSFMLLSKMIGEFAVTLSSIEEYSED